MKREQRQWEYSNKNPRVTLYVMNCDFPIFSVGDKVYDSDMNSEDDEQDKIDLLRSKEKNVALKEKTGIYKTSHMTALVNV